MAIGDQVPHGSANTAVTFNPSASATATELASAIYDLSLVYDMAAAR